MGRIAAAIEPSSDVEGVLESALNAAGIQHAFHFPHRSGYILDFAWPAAKLCVEVDGHPRHFNRRGKSRDGFRTYRLHRDGWIVMRFTARDVEKDAAACVVAIQTKLVELQTR